MTDNLDHELRRTGFTSTDFGAIFGLDPHRDLHSIWAMKVGGLIPDPPTWRMRLGKYLERAVINIYADYTESAVTPLFDKTFRHPDYPHVLASPDALGDDLGVDAKVCSWDQRHRWGDTENDVPDSQAMQLHVCMEVLDRPRWDVALLTGDDFRIITVTRDREFGSYLMNEAERLWRLHFETKDNPPPIGGSRFSREWLRQTFPKNNWPDIRPATDEEIELLRHFGRIRAAQKAMKKSRERLENQIKNAIREREGLSWESGRLTWRLTKDSQVINWEGVAQTLMTRYLRQEDGSARDEAACRKLIEDHTFPRPGYRRIYFSSDEDYAVSEDAEVDDAA